MATCSGVIANGRCIEQLASANATTLATDGVRVFWSTRGATKLNAVSVEGGAPAQLFDADPDVIGAGPVIDSKNVYFLVSHENGEGAISSVPLAGGATTAIQSGSVGPPMAIGSGDLVYLSWAPTPSSSALTASPVSGAFSSRLAPVDKWSWIVALAADSSGAYWATASEASPVVSVNRASITAPPNAAVAGGDSLAQFDGFRAMAIDDDYVYVATGTAIQRVAKSGGAATTIATASATSLAADGAYVYFTNGDASTLEKVPRDGGATTVLASTGTGAHAAVVDGKSVYWADGSAIMKVTPK